MVAKPIFSVVAYERLGTYGNIGAPQRLEFTVVGSGANEVARIEGECKRLNQPILASSEFATITPNEWHSVGQHQLTGLTTPWDVYAVRP